MNEGVRLGELDSWIDLPSHLRTQSILLLGNGASRAVWDPFGYPSLFEKACTSVEHPLTSESQTLFASMGDTKNFEQVLGLLWGAQRVVTGLSMTDRGEIQDCYANVRDALIEAVRSVHLPWSEGLAGNLDEIQSELPNYKRIFTTNYDLIPYWALMRGDGPSRFKDFFQGGGVFDPSMGVGGYIPIYYLHGALHLYKTADHHTRKHVNVDGHNLLSLFSASFENGRVPLFVSEGTSADKMASIEESDYLRFAFGALRAWSGPVVVFGHSLSPDYDQHLIDALRPNDFRKAAISILPDDANKVALLQAQLMDRLPGWDLRFFESTTHPLGSPSRRAPAR